MIEVIFLLIIVTAQFFTHYALSRRIDMAFGCIKNINASMEHVHTALVNYRNWQVQATPVINYVIASASEQEIAQVEVTKH